LALTPSPSLNDRCIPWNGLQPSIQIARTQFSSSNPSYKINIDRTLLGSLDLNYDDVVSTIADFAGGNNLTQTSVEGGTRDVVVISKAEERSTID
jgi:multidrug efflux pump subunit AcrB